MTQETDKELIDSANELIDLFEKQIEFNEKVYRDLTHIMTQHNALVKEVEKVKEWVKQIDLMNRVPPTDRRQ